MLNAIHKYCLVCDRNTIHRRSGISSVIAVASYVRTTPKPRRDLRREAPQISSRLYVLAYLAIATSVALPPTCPSRIG